MHREVAVDANKSQETKLDKNAPSSINPQGLNYQNEVELNYHNEVELDN